MLACSYIVEWTSIAQKLGGSRGREYQTSFSPHSHLPPSEMFLTRTSIRGHLTAANPGLPEHLFDYAQVEEAQNLAASQPDAINQLSFSSLENPVDLLGDE